MTRYRRLSGMDSFFVYLESPVTQHHTLKISILDPSTDPQGWSFDRLLEIMKGVVVQTPLWRQRCLKTPAGLHFPVWVDDPHFDLEYHVRHIGCPAPGDHAAFCKLVSELYSRGLDLHRPLWQMWAIEGLEGGRVALVLMFHHAYCDGVGILKLLDQLQPATPFAQLSPPTPSSTHAWNPEPLPSRLKRLWWGLKDLPPLFATNFLPLVNGIRQRIRVTREFAGTDRELPPSPTDRSIPAPFCYPITSANRSFSCRSLEMARFKRISKHLGYTINDLFIACATGALRRLFEETGQAVDKPTIATMPMNIVPVEERIDYGNFATVEHLLLPIHIANPLERLKASNATCNAAKFHFDKTKDASIQALINMIHPCVTVFFNWLNTKRGGGVFPMSNITVSNIPGPREKRYVGGWLVDQWFSTGQINHCVALNMTVWSYADQYNICALTDRARNPNVNALIDNFVACLDEYETLIPSGPEAGAQTGLATEQGN